MRQVGIAELRDHAEEYLTGLEPLAIEHGGETVGYFYPSASQRRKHLPAAMARLEKTLAIESLRDFERRKPPPERRDKNRQNAEAEEPEAETDQEQHLLDTRA